MIQAVFKALRPHQWAKNLLVFAPLLFSQKLLEPSYVWKSVACFFIFCFLAGSIYLLNDIVDVEKDRLHPKKKFRPIASGQLSIESAQKIWPFLAFFSIASAVFLGSSWQQTGRIVLVLASYFLLNLAYSLRLKQIPYVDVSIVAFGFLLRVLAGILVLNVYISKWILPCTFLLALYLALGKRRHELATFDENAIKQRKVLSKYNVAQLDFLLAVVSAITILSYCGYTLDPHTVKNFQTHYLIYTIPFAVFGIVRFLQLMGYSVSTESPTQELLKDIPSLLNVLLWVLSVIYVIYNKPGKGLFSTFVN